MTISQPQPGQHPNSNHVIACSIAVSSKQEKGIEVRYKVENHTKDTIHLVHTDRMPYVAVSDSNHIKLSWSVQQPNPDRDYLALEIPTTIALASGQHREETFVLEFPIQTHDHFSLSHSYTGKLDDAINVVAEIGYLPFSIEVKDRLQKGYKEVVDAQRLCMTDSVLVHIR